MTVPNGEAGINLPDFGVTDNGSIPGLPSRTQANAENFYKGMVQDSPSWGASSPIFGAVVNALIAGVFHLVADRVGTIPLVGGALEQVIDGFADWLFQTEGTANTAQVTATSKSKVTRATSAPSTPATNDVWIDTTATDGYVLYKVWNGTSWVVTTEKIAAEVADKIATGDDIQAFTANGTWTKPSGAKRVVVYLVGGSAGGGRGGSSSSRGGGSGGPGGWQRGFEFQATDLTGTVSVTIGGAGSGATSDGTAGTSGGTTSFGSYLSATGGTCGASATANNVLGIVGNAGSGVDSGLLLNYGGRGGSGSATPEDGGAGPFSAGGAKGAGTGGAAGSAGSDPSSVLLFGPGGGGGGGAHNNTTGNGGAGGAGARGAGGGGGGSYNTFGSAGNGGAGSLGKAWIVTKFV